MDRKGFAFEIILILVGTILGGIIAIGGVYVQNDLAKESIESELVIIDMHLDEKEYFQIKDQLPGNISITNENNGEKITNFSFLEVNITVVNSIYSKYPTKIEYSIIDLTGGNKKTLDGALEYDSKDINYAFKFGETTPILSLSSGESIYPSEQSTITQYVFIPFEGNYNLTGSFKMGYYDPVTHGIKNINDEVFILQIMDGKLENITPLKHYVTIKGYKMEDNHFAVYG